MTAVALTIAGSDPSGGAGIQADLKTFHQFGVYGQAVIAVITVQNTQRVSRVVAVEADLVAGQIEAVVSDFAPAAAKTGALGSAENVRTVARAAASFSFPLVVDPVMVSKHGARLLSPDAERAIKHDLLPRAALATPNLPEAEVLAGMQIMKPEDWALAAERIEALGARAVLIKGGHSEGEPVDWLFAGGTCTAFSAPRIPTAHTHGTGCTLSAAITAGLASGADLLDAVRRAKEYVQAAIATASEMNLHFGGIGPLNHFVCVSPGISLP